MPYTTLRHLGFYCTPYLAYHRDYNRLDSEGLAILGLLSPFFSFSFPIAGSKQERIREVCQGRAFCARRASGRSEAESLDEPPALRTLVRGKMKPSTRVSGLFSLLVLFFAFLEALSQRLFSPLSVLLVAK